MRSRLQPASAIIGDGPPGLNYQQAAWRRLSAGRRDDVQPDKTEDSLAAIYADFVTLWQAAPMPAARQKVQSRAEDADAVAVALAWGWMVRVSRTGEAAMLLEEAGFSDEAAPLLRSMLEHSIRLRWGAAAGSDFVEAALRMRAASLRIIMR